MRNAADGLQQSFDIATHFLESLGRLTPADRSRISLQSFGNSAHTGAMLAIADEITSLRAKVPGDPVGRFIAAAELRIAALQLGAELEGLAKGAVRGLVVQHLPDHASLTRQLYSPFEAVIPLSSLQTAGAR